MYKDILVYVDNAKNRDNSVRVAARFAKDHGASLTGLYVQVSTIPQPSLYADSRGVELVQKELEARSKRAAQAKVNFLKIAELMGVSAIWLEVDQDDHPLKLLAYVDLIVINQISQNATRSFNNKYFINRLVLETAKPVCLFLKSGTQKHLVRRLWWVGMSHVRRSGQCRTPCLY